MDRVLRQIGQSSRDVPSTHRSDPLAVDHRGVAQHDVQHQERVATDPPGESTRLRVGVRHLAIDHGVLAHLRPGSRGGRPRTHRWRSPELGGFDRSSPTATARRAPARRSWSCSAQAPGLHLQHASSSAWSAPFREFEVVGWTRTNESLIHYMGSPVAHSGSNGPERTRPGRHNPHPTVFGNNR